MHSQMWLNWLTLLLRRLQETIVKWILFLAGLLVENWLFLGEHSEKGSDAWCCSF